MPRQLGDALAYPEPVPGRVAPRSVPPACRRHGDHARGRAPGRGRGRPDPSAAGRARRPDRAGRRDQCRGRPVRLGGARLHHVLTDPELYFSAGRHPIKALYVWQVGLGIWGVEALGAVGAWIGPASRPSTSTRPRWGSPSLPGRSSVCLRQRWSGSSAGSRTTSSAPASSWSGRCWRSACSVCSRSPTRYCWATART